MDRIVVGVDGSPCSIAALRWAIAEARLRGAHVVAVNAWSMPHVSTVSEAEHLIDVDFEPLRDDALEVLDAAVDGALAEADGVVVERVAVEGPAAEALVDAAAEATLLVVGCRGRGSLKGLLLGSVSQECAHRAPCPTVVVRDGRR